MRRPKILSPWQCDSDQDYYAQFADKPEDDREPDDDEDFESQDDDCDYWKSNCYGRG